MKLLILTFLLYELQKHVLTDFCEKLQSKFLEQLNKVVSFILSISAPLILIFTAINYVAENAEPMVIHLVGETENLLTTENLNIIQSLLPLIYNAFSLAPIEIFIVSLVSIGCSAVVITGYHYILDVKKADAYEPVPVFNGRKVFESKAVISPHPKKIFLTLCHLRN